MLHLHVVTSRKENNGRIWKGLTKEAFSLFIFFALILIWWDLAHRETSNILSEKCLGKCLQQMSQQTKLQKKIFFAFFDGRLNDGILIWFCSNSFFNNRFGFQSNLASFSTYNQMLIAFPNCYLWGESFSGKQSSSFISPQ